VLLVCAVYFVLFVGTYAGVLIEVLISGSLVGIYRYSGEV